MSSERVMDVWDVASFPEPVIEALRAVDGAFVAHTLNVTQNRYEPDPTDEPRRLGLDVIARTMAGVTIRAWHYGRLCADEVELLMREGLWPTSQHRRNMRLRTRQDAGDLTSDDVASLTACCELNTDSLRCQGRGCLHDLHASAPRGGLCVQPPRILGWRGVGAPTRRNAPRPTAGAYRRARGPRDCAAIRSSPRLAARPRRGGD